MDALSFLVLGLRSRSPLAAENLFLRKQLALCSERRDFLVAITATFGRLYVFVVLDMGSRRIVHWNVTEHPTAAWTVPQFRAIGVVAA